MAPHRSGFLPAACRRFAPALLILLTAAAQPTLAREAAGAAGAAPPSAAASVSAAEASAQRQLLGRERAAVEARYSDRQRECRQRFVVTSCLDEAKAQRRQALDGLRARQIAIDEARRRERSDERRAELAEKAAEDARREAARVDRGPADAASRPGLGRPFESPRPAPARGVASGPHDRVHSGFGIEPAPREPASVRGRREAASRAAFEARQTDAAEHRAETIERAKTRSAQKRTAAPLPPVRAASSAASTAPR